MFNNNKGDKAMKKKKYITYQECEKIILEYGESPKEDMEVFDKKFANTSSILTFDFEKWIGYPLNEADILMLEW
jgi:hypothetical protein